MKKLRITALLLVAVMMLTALSGCNQETLTYTVLEFGSGAGIGGKHGSDIPEWSLEGLAIREDPAALAEMTVTFDGKTYTADYDCSYTKVPHTYVSHSYDRKLEDGTFVSFDINAETKELTSISISKNTERISLEEPQCREIADAVADDYISLKDYKVKADPHDDKLGYVYTYYREINGYETADRVVIVIRNGALTHCDISTAGTFKDVRSLSVDEEKAVSVIDEKMQKIYGHLGTMSGYYITGKQWVKLPDGRCARIYTIEVNFKDGNDYSGGIFQLAVA